MKLFDYSLSNILLGTAVTSALVITLPQSVQALTGQEINQIAKQTTVFIGGTDNKDYQTQGSGVIISQKGNTYYVLTAAHVVSKQDTSNGEVKYAVTTHDQQNHQVTSVKILADDVDLAVIEFTSNNQYQQANLAKSSLVTEGVPIFVSGWPKPTAIGGGNNITRQFSDGRISNILPEPYYGYQLGYTNNTLSGMSGGPVFDAGARVIGIHGLADVDSNEMREILEGGIDSDTAKILLKTGINYGIPIDTFLTLQAQKGLYLGLNVEDTPPPELGANTVKEIKQEMEKDPDRIDTQAYWAKLGGDLFKNMIGEVCGRFIPFCR